jgi:hypothetical protein
MRENWFHLDKSFRLAGAVRRALTGSISQKRLLRHFSFRIAPALGLLGIAFCILIGLGFWRAAPYTGRIVALMLLILLFFCLLALYAVFITMIMTWDIDRISYAVEEEAERQLLKRISSEKFPDGSDQSEAGKLAPGKINAALDAMIARRAEYLWMQLLQSGCIDFPRADVKLAIKTIREHNPIDNSGIFDAIKTLVVSKIFAGSYLPRLRLKIMDKLVFKFVKETSALFISVLTVFLATVLLWSVAFPAIFSAKPDTMSVCIFVADLTLRGAIFTVLDHLGLKLTHLAPRGDATLLIAHTLAFRLFMSVFVIATFLKLLKLMLRRRYLAA